MIQRKRGFIENEILDLMIIICLISIDSKDLYDHAFSKQNLLTIKQRIDFHNLHFLQISRALCVGYNPKEDHYSTKRGLFLPVLLLSSSINDAEAYYCVFSSSVDLIEIS